MRGFTIALGCCSAILAFVAGILVGGFQRPTDRSGVCNVADLGLRVAFSILCANKKIVVPPGSWTVSTALLIPDGSTVEWLGRDAVVKYTGTGSAMLVKLSKNVTLIKPNIDLSEAGPAARALHVAGLWFGTILDPHIVLNGVNQEGISVETSFNDGVFTPWGSYLLEIVNPDVHGLGAAAIRTRQTSGDTRYVTHLNIRGGWSKGVSYGLDLDRVATGRVEGWVADTGIDAIRVTNSADMVFMPGELGPGTGYGINFGAGNAGHSLLMPSMQGVGGSLGYINTATYEPQTLEQGRMRLFGSNTNQGYWAEIKSIFSYAKSFALTVRGGDGSAPELMSYGSAQGIWLGQGNVPTRLGTAAATLTNVFGLPYISAAAGTPTAAPVTYAGQAPVVVDSTNGKLCAYIGATWKCATLN